MSSTRSILLPSIALQSFMARCFRCAAHPDADWVACGVSVNSGSRVGIKLRRPLRCTANSSIQLPNAQPDHPCRRQESKRGRHAGSSKCSTTRSNISNRPRSGFRGSCVGGCCDRDSAASSGCPERRRHRSPRARPGEKSARQPSPLCPHITSDLDVALLLGRSATSSHQRSLGNRSVGCPGGDNGEHRAAQRA
jgi:hypothetical protein